MRAVLRSIKPYWLYLILLGKKTIEVGKDIPKKDDWCKIVYLYCAKDMRSFRRIPEEDREWMRECLGKVVCKFLCDKIYDITPHIDANTFVNQYICGWNYGEDFDCLTHEELVSYLGGKQGYGWHITQLAVYSEPIELNRFVRYRTEEEIERHFIIGTLTGMDAKPYIKRPPQSWMYMEAWLYADPDLQIAMFGYSVNVDKGKPTNSEFIATVADYILLTKGGEL